LKSTGPSQNLTIDRLARGGSGVGRLTSGPKSGMVVFVPLTAPGDQIHFEIVSEKKSFCLGQLKEITSPSEFRRPADCEYFESCGGCTWLHVDYEEQVRQKKEILGGAFTKIGFKDSFDFVPSPSEFGYRNRIQLEVREGVGHYHMRGSSELVPIKACKIADPAINHFLQTGLDQLPDGRFEIAVDFRGKTHVRGIKDPHNPQLFSQVNEPQNQNIKSDLKKVLKDIPKNLNAIELYAGSGNFTGVLLESFKFVKSVEIDKASVEQGRKLFPAARWIANDVDRQLKKEVDEYELMFLDPPRTGVADKSLANISRLKPDYILYLSCDPMTQTRDIQRLQKTGYEIILLRGYDMFPQTDHIESLVLLRANPA
jgi:23S rRNA (uracil1939-C5)-methyltransferase